MKQVSLLLLVFVLWEASTVNPLPGLTSGFGYGYDPVFDEPRAPVFKWNYGQRMTWTYPLNQESYLLPDELWAQNLPHVASSTEYTICKELRDYMSKKWHWSSWSIGFGFFSFSMAKASGLVKQLLSDKNSTLYIVDREFNLFLLTSWPYDTLKGQQNSALQDYINGVPGDPEQPGLPQAYDPVAYGKFIEEFGTHYVYRSRMGGMYTYYFKVSNELISKYSASWVQQQVSIAVSIYGVTLGFSWGHTKQTEKLDSEFQGKTVTTIQRRGGTQAAADRGFKEWYATLIDNPTMLKPELKPISDLCHNPTIKANMLRAITEYNNKQPQAKPKAVGPSDPDFFVPEDETEQFYSHEWLQERVRNYRAEHPEAGF